MEILKLFVLFSCVIAGLCASEVSQGGRHKRQLSGLNGAHTDAMDRSRHGGFGGSYNPMITAGGFGGRLGGGYGGTVWSSGKNSIGLGAAARADVGLNLSNRRPFVRAPELGVGATYNRGLNSFSLGAGRTFSPRPSNQFGFTYSRRFKRAFYDTEDDDGQSVFEDNENQLPLIEENEERLLVDNEAKEDVDDGVVITRNRRQTAMNTAMANSLPNTPYGTPQLSYQIDAAGRNLRNFGASGSAGAGMRVWERGHHSIGLGVGASGDLARFGGRTYTGNHQIGAGLGYQNRGFSATLGAGRTLGRFPSNHYGLNLGYRFRRALEDDLK